MARDTVFAKDWRDIATERGNRLRLRVHHGARRSEDNEQRRDQVSNQIAGKPTAGQVPRGTCPAVDQNLSVLETRKSLG